MWTRWQRSSKRRLDAPRARRQSRRDRMEPSPTRRLHAVAAVILHRLRTWPWLTSAAFVFGVVLSFLETSQTWRTLTESGIRAESLTAGVQHEPTRRAWLEVFSAQWGRATLYLVPAAMLAALRLRRKALIFPVAVACLHLTVWWIGTDLLANFHRSLHDPLGMEPSRAAYTARLVLMAAFLLSPPVLLWLYFRATILDRYLLRNFLGPLVLCLGGITAIFISMDLLNNANDFAGYSIGQVFLYYAGQTPRIIVTVAEAALLLATLFALGKMSRHNELTACGSAGRSVLRMLRPMLLCALWISFAVLVMNFQLAPEAERAREEKEARRKAGTEGARDTAVFNVFYRNRDARRSWCLHHVPYELSAENPIEDIAVWQQNAAGDLTESWFARDAMWTAATGVWELRQVVHYTFTDAAGAPLRTPHRDELPGLLQTAWPETPAAMLSDKLDPAFLGVPGLLSCLKSRATLPDKAIAGYETTLHWRYALPFRCFLIVLLAAPLGIVAARRNVLGGVCAAIAIFIALRFLSTIVLKAGEGQYLPPAVAAWTINLAFALAGFALLWHRSRNRPWSWNFLRGARRS